MKKIYLNESQLDSLNDSSSKEITFYEYIVDMKKFLKDLLKKPSEATPSDIITNGKLSKNELIKKMKDIGLLKSSEKIDEVPMEEGSDKKVAKRFIKYSIPKARFSEKMRQMYDDVIGERKLVKEDGEGGATSCGSVMQGGGSNPSSGQYETPFASIQRRKFFKPAIDRNKGSISVNYE